MVQHLMDLKIIDNKHQWICETCGRIVLIGDNEYTVINQGNPYTLHKTPHIADADSLLSLDFETYVIPPEEKALFDRWESEFDGLQ